MKIMVNKRKLLFIGALITLSGFLFLVVLESVMRPYAKEGLYFQDWSSEKMMQNVSIKDLSDAPLETIFNIHIEPPASDIIRAILVHIWPASNPLTSLRHVDFLLYLLWALVYSLLGLVVFLWTFQLTGMGGAIIAAVVFLLHPACIFYATFLDNTLLTSFLVLLLYYQLWKIKNNSKGSIVVVAIVALALFFTKPIFQWPFVLVVGFSLLLFGMSKRRVMIFLLITGGVMSLYMAKQYFQFGILTTSSFTGQNLNRSVGMGTSNYRGYLDTHSIPEGEGSGLPAVLTREKKIDGSTNFNNIKYLEYNQQLIDEYKDYILSTPMSRLINSYLENLRIYFEPSSWYTNNVIVDRLPWRSLYDRIFSFPILIGLLALLGIAWLLRAAERKDFVAYIGLLLPGLAILAVTVLFEKGENMRFKFFLEPVIFVFLVAQFYDTCRQVYQRTLAKRRARTL
jgi:hypothetical protein